MCNQTLEALTAWIEPGRRSRERRHITSGPIVRPLPEREDERDLPLTRRKPETGHGYKTEQTKEGHT